MALVTIQRSPSSNNSPSHDEITGFQDEVDANRNPKSLSECYFAGKGTALVLPDADAHKCSTNSSTGGRCGRYGGTQGNSTIQKHLQSMFYLLRQEETLKMAVKLESNHPSRTRYLVVVSRMGSRAEESCLLGIDCNEKTTVGLVLKVLANTKITLDGDGGFSVSVCERHHIFKPVSVQAMWSALQTLYKVSGKATKENYFQGGTTHDWVEYYEKRIESDRSCLNEWHAMDNLESRRPPSPDSIRTKPTERNETEQVIRATLKEIMMSVDLDEVTSKVIRSRLEEELDVDLGEYKSFIDQEMLVILGQMDAPTEIFDHVYLGSEWNASNYDELQKNGVGHILNVTREIDNFFPGTFDYLNIRVYDDEKTDLLKHWDDTFKYITKAREKGSKVLVHCKMGVSRSASVVIAYAMKAFNWDFSKALDHVKDKRNCIKPNTSFLSQLETYQGILDAMKNKEKLQRSKSENNLKAQNCNKTEKVLPGREPTPNIKLLSKSFVLDTNKSGHNLRQFGERPKSWSPDNLTTRESRNATKTSPISLSLEDLSQKSSSKESVQTSSQEIKLTLARHVLMPCDNGESYSVSPNQIVHLPGHDYVSCHRMEERRFSQSLEKKVITNLPTRFGTDASYAESSCNNNSNLLSDVNVILRAEKVEADTWDPGESDSNRQQPQHSCNSTSKSVVCDLETNSVISENPQVWTSSTVVKTTTQSAVLPSNKVPDESQQANQTTVKVKNVQTDPFSNQLDRVFDREEKKQQRLSAIAIAPPEPSTDDKHPRECPSRQSSWSSYDSAVVMGFPENSELSRHSSWGSGDTRMLPSRNSSWGSYDMRPRGTVYYQNEKGEKIPHSTSDLLETSSSGIFPYDKEDIPWYPGTVKRTKQRLEGNSTGKHNSSSDSMTSSNLSLMRTPSSETLLFDFSSDRDRKPPAEAVNEVLLDSAKTTSQDETESSSAITETININIPVVLEPQKSSSYCRLSISAPEPSTMMELIPQECSPLSRSASNVSDLEVVKVPKDVNSSSVVHTAQCSSVKQHRTFLENLHNKDSKQQNSISPLKKSCDEFSSESNSTSTSSSSGIVMNLKKEFEAKSDSDGMTESSTSKPKKSVNSLPSSPVSLHQSREQIQKVEDKNMKSLIGMFEKNKEETIAPVKFRQKPLQSPNTQNRSAVRHSCIEVSVVNKNTPPVRIVQSSLISNLNKNCAQGEKNGSTGEFKRPPSVPVVRSIAATVIATAAKKQQQYGKSHPLARLNIKPRHNNPVYNTM